jgi:hypothetical protein
MCSIKGRKRIGRVFLPTPHRKNPGGAHVPHISIAGVRTCLEFTVKTGWSSLCDNFLFKPILVSRNFISLVVTDVARSS